MKHYRIELSESEYSKLHDIISDEATGSELRKRCQILLALDTMHGSVMSYKQIMTKFAVGNKTIANVKKAFIAGNGINTIYRKKREFDYKLTEQMKKRILILVNSRAYTNSGKWSLKTLTDRVNELFPNDTVSRETIRQFLKNNGISLRKVQRSKDKNPSYTVRNVRKHDTFDKFGSWNDSDRPKNYIDEDVKIVEKYLTNDEDWLKEIEDGAQDINTIEDSLEDDDDKYDF